MDARKLVDTLKDTLEIYKNKNSIPAPTDTRHDVKYLIDMEAQYALRQFERMLHKLHAVEESKLSEAHAEIFLQCLAEREKMIERTPADYFARPNSAANELYLNASMHFNLFASQSGLSVPSPRAMAMPSIRLWKGAVTGRDLRSGIPLHGLMRTDDGVNLLEVGKIVSSWALKSNGKKVTYLPSDQSRRLSSQEESRIMNHSELAIELFKQRELDYFRQQSLIQALESDEYEVTAKFADGYSNLQRRLLDLGLDLFADREQLLDYMSCKLKRHEWNQYLGLLMGEKSSEFSDKDLDVYKKKYLEPFNKFVSPEGGFSTTATNRSIYNGKLRHDVAAIFLLARAHVANRKLEGNQTGWLGFLGGYNKDTKIGALEILLDYLTSQGEVENLKPWADYLKDDLPNAVSRNRGEQIDAQIKQELGDGKLGEDGVAERKKVLIDNHVANIRGALQQGTLGYITQQFEIVQKLHDEALKQQEADSLQQDVRQVVNH